MDFCHLHNHSEYSVLDGFGTTEQYAKRAGQLGFKYLGLTDHGSIDGLISFQKSCNKYGIIPILGSELYIVHDITTKTKKRGHITVWVKNQDGFNNLCKLLTFANTEGFYYRPRVTHEMLLKHYKGLVIGTACLQTFMYEKRGEMLFQDLHDALGGDLYCEIMPHLIPKQIKLNRLCKKIHRKYGTKIIATNDCHYINRSHCKVHEVLLAIQQKKTWDDPKRWSFGIKGLYLKSIKEMKDSLLRQGFYKKEYLQNTIEVAEKCSDFQIAKYPVRLPRLEGIKTKDEGNSLEYLCNAGYKKLFGKQLRFNNLYHDRFKEEFNLIKRKKFIRYFLIVWELIDWCKKNDIMTGPGRGSVGGSFIAHLLGITTINPIKHKLLFSRFISEDRIDLPDIDIDFEDRKRHLIRQHLEERYGYKKVAGVSSFNRMQSRAVIKDVGRVFKIPYPELDNFTKLIEDSGGDTNIQDAIDEYPEAKEFSLQYPKIIKYAKKLEGQVRSHSQHAAAIVISKEPIGTSGRCNLLEREGVTLINWEKNDTEYVGLMKLDVLGLKLLSILSEAKQLIKANHGKDIDFEKIDVNDKAVIKDISKGNTVGIFQFNMWATKNLVQEINAETFQHLADTVALVRPGPYGSGMTAEYIKRKKGKGGWARKHKVYEKITKETYGVIVYQEQVMAVISEVAGLGYSTADQIRKIIGKKRDPKEFEKYKKQFFDGCKKTKIFNREEANDFWIGLQEHARYSFNKSHSVEYATLAMWCGWLKYYYPTEFMCASLTYGAKTKKAELVEEAYRLGLTLVLPKIGISNAEEWVSKNNKLYIPFREVKGIGEVKALKAAKQLSKKTGNIDKFFDKKKETIRHKGKFGKQLDEIGAYNTREEMQVTDRIKEYFDFRIVTNPKQSYKTLYQLCRNKIRLDRLDLIISGDIKEMKHIAKGRRLLRKKSFSGHKHLYSCRKCELYKEGTRPVAPSPGQYNVFIIGEGPWTEEDEAGEGFVGRSGKALWAPLSKKGYEREIFHVTNIWKCYPQYSRKANAKQIKACTPYLDIELKQIKPRLILAFGNYTLQFFTNRKGGITDMSGKVGWHEGYGAWIVYCIHPAAVLHNPDNEVYYKAGIKTFCKMLKAMGI